MENSRKIRTNRRIVKIGDRTFKMDFDMEALSQAEQVYANKYGREVNVAEIIADLFAVKLSACMAFAFGALLSAGEAVTWEEFSKEIFTYDSFDAVFDEVSDAIKELFEIDGGEQENAEAPEGGEKNL